MTCACSAAGSCIVHDGAWARLQSIVRELGQNEYAVGNPARNIQRSPIPHSEFWDRIEPLAVGATWEPCDTVHPGPAGYERVAAIFRLAAERARLLGLLVTRA